MSKVLPASKGSLRKKAAFFVVCAFGVSRLLEFIDPKADDFVQRKGGNIKTDSAKSDKRKEL